MIPTIIQNNTPSTIILQNKIKIQKTKITKITTYFSYDVIVKNYLQEFCMTRKRPLGTVSSRKISLSYLDWVVISMHTGTVTVDSTAMCRWVFIHISRLNTFYFVENTSQAKKRYVNEFRASQISVCFNVFWTLGLWGCSLILFKQFSSLSKKEF
jgi:hypothetical protein